MPDRRIRTRLGRVAIVLAALAVLTAAPPALAFDQAGYEEAVNTILCDCGCHPQTVHECACGRAAEMRQEIHALIESGMTGDAVIAKYVAENGEQIRIAPVATGFNLLAWLGPLVLLVVACGAMVLLIRRWQRARPADAEADAAPVETPPADAAYHDRLRRRLEEMQ